VICVHPANPFTLLLLLLSAVRCERTSPVRQYDTRKKDQTKGVKFGLKLVFHQFETGVKTRLKTELKA